MTRRAQRPEVVRHEDTLEVGTEVDAIGNLHARKRVEVVTIARDLTRAVEKAAVERVTADEGDSGEIETLPDGSISIPVFEEELVVTKRTVVRERIVIRKEAVTKTERVEAKLRRERVEAATERRIHLRPPLQTGGTAR